MLKNTTQKRQTSEQYHRTSRYLVVKDNCSYEEICTDVGGGCYIPWCLSKKS